MSTKKRPPVDLSALTSDLAMPMAEAVQRTAPQSAANVSRLVPKNESKAPANVPTANLEALAFKVSPEFRRRFRQRAVNADLKLNELLFAALDAWEEQQGIEI